MTQKANAEVVDGRRLRSERSRQAIVEAGISLMESGVLVPTAQQISDAAGVGIRTFFRHFEDMESFFLAVDSTMRSSYEAVFLGGDRDGSLEERIEHAVEHHAKAYESINSVMLSTLAQLWRSETVRKGYARSQKGLKKDLDNWLPELEQLSRERREAVDAVASFEMWHRLRDTQGLGRKTSLEIISNMMKSLILDH